jgi:hypothetical protein
MFMRLQTRTKRSIDNRLLDGCEECSKRLTHSHAVPSKVLLISSYVRGRNLTAAIIARITTIARMTYITIVVGR